MLLRFEPTCLQSFYGAAGSHENSIFLPSGLYFQAAKILGMLRVYPTFDDDRGAGSHDAF